jgi:methylated-DNA-protein-cysteine methyltransferase related protein
MSAPLYEKIYALVRQVPRGRVTTYGTIAKIVGGCTAREVGYAMAATPEGSKVPWQRVINSQGKISPHGVGFGSAIQRQLLEEEGILFDAAGKTDLKKFGWPDQEYSTPSQQESLFPDL